MGFDVYVQLGFRVEASSGLRVEASSVSTTVFLVRKEGRRVKALAGNSRYGQIPGCENWIQLPKNLSGSRGWTGWEFGGEIRERGRQDMATKCVKVRNQSPD